MKRIISVIIILIAAWAGTFMYFWPRIDDGLIQGLMIASLLIATAAGGLEIRKQVKGLP